MNEQENDKYKQQTFDKGPAALVQHYALVEPATRQVISEI